MASAGAIRVQRRSAELARPCADIGTSSLTGVRALALPKMATKPLLVGHPVFATTALSASDCLALGSDFARVGFVFEPPTILDDVFTDHFGVEWLVADGQPAILSHPLEQATMTTIARHRRPHWPQRMQVPEREADDALIVADAPCPGLLDMCFGLRNAWRFMEDIADNWQAASALLDWSMETILSSYEAMLGGLALQPDVVIYGDDMGYQGGMFLSLADFRTFIKPRLQHLMLRLRKMTSAAICFHSCGAIRPVLGDIASLGVEIVNVDPYARGMILADIRRELPKDIILHGSFDVAALGAAIHNGDRGGVAALAVEYAQSAPVIAAPVDNIQSRSVLADAARGISFLKALTHDDLDALAGTGPMASLIDRASGAAAATPPPILAGRTPPLITPGGWLH